MDMLDKRHATQRKMDGFNGQKALVLPYKIIQGCENTRLVQQLLITDIGFYPKAKFHYRERLSGVSQHIFIYCIDGKGWFSVGNDEHKISRGQFFIIPANTAHSYGSQEDNPWSIYWLHFKGTSSDNFVNLLTREKTQFYGIVNFAEERIRLFENMYRTLKNGYSAENLGYINMCLWHFLSSFCYPDVFRKLFNKDQKDVIDISIDFMQQHLSEPLTLRQLASEANISPSHYSSLFKKKTGYPPLEYFSHIKVQAACQYLQFTTLRIKEIAYKLGIDDPYYFSRLFSNLMGQSPLSYRNRKQ